MGDDDTISYEDFQKAVEELEKSSIKPLDGQWALPISDLAYVEAYIETNLTVVEWDLGGWSRIKMWLHGWRKKDIERLRSELRTNRMYFIAAMNRMVEAQK